MRGGLAGQSRAVTASHHVALTLAGTNIALGVKAWDPYPFILMNPFLSMLAAIQACVIMMSQNREDTKDRRRGELDFEIHRPAAADIQAPHVS
jgi:CRP/FNR family transcriptional regulator, cyclic AMP receptor protein